MEKCYLPPKDTLFLRKSKPETFFSYENTQRKCLHRGGTWKFSLYQRKEFRPFLSNATKWAVQRCPLRGDCISEFGTLASACPVKAWVDHLFVLHHLETISTGNLFAGPSPERKKEQITTLWMKTACAHFSCAGIYWKQRQDKEYFISLWTNTSNTAFKKKSYLHGYICTWFP